jgi:hypothetical protein
MARSQCDWHTPSSYEVIILQIGQFTQHISNPFSWLLFTKFMDYKLHKMKKKAQKEKPK